MNINGEAIALSNKNKKWLYQFFLNNHEFLKENNLYVYENLKQFGDLYEQYLKDNKLEENDLLKLFLVEIRLEQLEFKITAKSNKMKTNIAVRNISIINLTNTIDKWLHECFKEEEYNDYIKRTR